MPGMRRTRLASSLAALALLTGCQKSFDERYEDAQKKMASQATSIDKDLAAKASEASRSESEAASAVAPGSAPVASPPS